MKSVSLPLVASLVVLTACGPSPYERVAAQMNSRMPTSSAMQAPSSSPMPMQVAGDRCGAGQYQSMVGGPSMAVMSMNIPGSSRHYGSDEPVATNDPTRLNFVHSGSAVDAVVDPSSRVVRVFCG